MDTSKAQFKTIDEYVNTFPKEVRDKLQMLRKVINEEIPGAEEAISYKLPAFKLNGRYVVYLSAWKEHLSLYPFSGEMVKSMKEAADYKTSGKGTIQFPFNKPLPIPFIRKIVKFLLKENLALRDPDGY